MASKADGQVQRRVRARQADLPRCRPYALGVVIDQGPLWVLVVSKELAKDIGGDSRERRVSQAAIAAISGLMPTMFMTRVRL